MKRNAEDTIKKAILLEHKGRAFYNSISKSTHSEAIREIFLSMALEEEEHLRVLSEQLKSLSQTGSFKFMELQKLKDDFSPNVLTARVKEEISGAGYEAAAITAAMHFEQQAIDYYSSQAKATRDEDEARIFNWLAEWEKTHLDLLVEIDRELQQQIWFDQNFWPY
ncbi:MAG: ferritin family protein [bacterium]